MNMFWDGKQCVSSEWGDGAFEHMLRAAAIATLVSSCSTMNAQSEADITRANAEEPPDPPLVEQLPASLSDEFDEIKKQASEVFGVELGRLQNAYAVISYTDEDEEEKLLAFVPTAPGPAREVDVRLFTIPTPDRGDGTTEFGQAIVVYTGSPAAQTSCGASSAGGTRYCRP